MPSSNRPTSAKNDESMVSNASSCRESVDQATVRLIKEILSADVEWADYLLSMANQQEMSAEDVARLLKENEVVVKEILNGFPEDNKKGRQCIEKILLTGKYPNNLELLQCPAPPHYDPEKILRMAKFKLDAETFPEKNQGQIDNVRELHQLLLGLMPVVVETEEIELDPVVTPQKIKEVKEAKQNPTVTPQGLKPISMYAFILGKTGRTPVKSNKDADPLPDSDGLAEATKELVKWHVPRFLEEIEAARAKEGLEDASCSQEEADDQLKVEQDILPQQEMKQQQQVEQQTLQQQQQIEEQQQKIEQQKLQIQQLQQQLEQERQVKQQQKIEQEQQIEQLQEKVKQQVLEIKKLQQIQIQIEQEQQINQQELQVKQQQQIPQQRKQQSPYEKKLSSPRGSVERSRFKARIRAIIRNQPLTPITKSTHPAIGRRGASNDSQQQLSKTGSKKMIQGHPVSLLGKMGSSSNNGLFSGGSPIKVIRKDLSGGSPPQVFDLRQDGFLISSKIGKHKRP